MNSEILYRNEWQDRSERERERERKDHPVDSLCNPSSAIASGGDEEEEEEEEGS